MDTRETVAWIVAGVLGLLVLASFTGNGTGLFGWGIMIGMMWLWMLLPVIVVVYLVVYLTDRNRGGGAPRDPE